MDVAAAKPIRRRIIVIIAAAMAVLLIVGYVRLPYAAVRNLSDYDILRDRSPIYLDSANSEMSAPQAWWLSLRMNAHLGSDRAPRMGANIKWYGGVVARVNASCYFGPVGAEGRDSLYVWFLGLWFPVHTFQHVMA